jgi:DNA-binding CsgD family transcriptional regulator
MYKYLFHISCHLFAVCLIAQKTTNNLEMQGYLASDTIQIKKLHIKIGELTDSITAFETLAKARQLCEKQSNKQWLITNVIIESYLYSTFNNQLKAIAATEVAEKLCYRYGLLKTLARIVINRGGYYSTLSNRKKAIECYYEALKLAEERKQELLQANCYEYLASDIYDEIDNQEANFKKAEEFIKNSMQIYEKNNDWLALTGAHINLSGVYHRHKDYVLAISIAKKGYALAKMHQKEIKLRDKFIIGPVSLKMIAAAFLGVKKYDSVLYYAKLAIPDLIKYEDKYVLGDLYTSVAIAHIQLQQYASAKTVLDSALQTAGQIDDKLTIMHAWQGYYMIDSATGNFAKAFENQRKYLVLKDSLYAADNLERISRLNLQFDTEKKNIEITEQKKQLQQQRRLIALASLLAIMAALTGWFIYRSKKLNQKLFAQKESALRLEKNNALMAQQLEETARKKADAEKQVVQDEKEKAELREKLKAEENLRLQEDIAFKHRELATVKLNIQQKTKLLEELREHLSTLAEKVDGDKQHAIKDMRRSIKNNISFDDDWDKVKIHFENVHTGFFEKLASLSLSLTSNELKQCAYIKINMSPKEVGSLLGIDAQSVRMSRYRIKKKIGLPEEKDLAEFITQL